jgi:phage-related protein
MEKEPFKSAMVRIFEGIKGAMDGIGTAWKPIGDMLVENAPLIDAVLTKLGETVGTVLGEIATAMSGGAFQQGSLGFVEGLQAALTGIDWNTIGALIGMVLGFLGELLPALTPIINQLVQSLMPILKDLFERVMPALGSLSELIVPILKVVGVAIQGLILVVGPLHDALKGVLEFLVGVFTGDWERAWKGLVDVFKGIMLFFLTLIVGIFGSLLMAVGDVFHNIHKTVYESGEGFRSLIGDIGKNISDAWNGFWDNFGSQTKTGWETVVKFFEKIPESIGNFFKNAGDWLRGSGKSLIFGLLLGIKQAAPFLGGVIDNMMKDVSGWFPHSPAKKGAFSGRGYTTFSGAALTRDFAKGIVGETDSVVKATDALMRAVSMPKSMNLALNATSGPVTSREGAILMAQSRLDAVNREQAKVDIHVTSPTPGAAALEIQRTLERSGIL